METCFRCRRPGHWAKNCDRSPCPRCGVRMDWHTQAGVVECAWRGQPCATCGAPPHPDSCDMRSSHTLDRLKAEWCERYASPDDTEAARELRAGTAWHRDADPDTFYRPPQRV